MRLLSVLNIAYLVAAGLLQSCGTNEFNGDGGSNRENNDEANPAMALTWLWPCAASAGENGAFEESDTHLRLMGPGPHYLSPQRLSGARVTFDIERCDAQLVKREVVFAIDVSGSMSSSRRTATVHDQYRNGTCGRMQALEDVIKSIKQTGEHSFAVVTFGSDVKQASSRLFQDKDELFADLLAQSPGASRISDLICAGIDGTNYEAALQGVRNIYDRSLAVDTLREVYFISDGEPSPADQHGKLIAVDLKRSASIATVMLGDRDDSILKNSIASKNIKGESLHARVAQSTELAAALGRLAQNSLVKAQISYGAMGRTNHFRDFSDKINDETYRFEAFTINAANAVDGIQVELRFTDRLGKVKSSVGKIVWNAAP